MEFPGVIPDSAKNLGPVDEDGNQLWRLTVMKDLAPTYMRLLQKAGYRCQEFHYDSELYTQNKNLEADLNTDLRSSKEKMYDKSKANF